MHTCLNFSVVWMTYCGLALRYDAERSQLSDVVLGVIKLDQSFAAGYLIGPPNIIQFYLAFHPAGQYLITWKLRDEQLNYFINCVNIYYVSSVITQWLGKVQLIVDIFHVTLFTLWMMLCCFPTIRHADDMCGVSGTATVSADSTGWRRSAAWLPGTKQSYSDARGCKTWQL